MATPPPADNAAPAPTERYAVHQYLGLVVGLGLFLLTLFTPAPTGLTPAAWQVAGLALLMGTLWISEALPIPAVALFPLVALPALGVMSPRDTAARYGDPLIFLFMGGFLLSLAMMRWGLHRRIALGLIGLLGTSPSRLVGGFLLSAAMLSMWVSNAATTLMLFPVALSLYQVIAASGQPTGPARGSSFAVALLLAVAYGASIGGLGTLIGTPPNGILSAYLREHYDFEVAFGKWMLIGVPLIIVGLPLSWLVLTRWALQVGAKAKPELGAVVAEARRELGPITVPEIMVAIVFGLTALAWVSRPLWAKAVPGVDDTVIAMAGACLLFLLPVKLTRGTFLLSWKEAEKLPWDTLVLYGGGLALAEGISRTRLAEWMAGGFSQLGALPPVLVVAIIVLVMLALTEFTSNTAVTAAFLPVVCAAGVGLGLHPAVLAIPATLAASGAFMMPVGTPPNAIVFASGLIPLPTMARVGFWMNVVFFVLITLVGTYWVPIVFDLHPPVAE